MSGRVAPRKLSASSGISDRIKLFEDVSACSSERSGDLQDSRLSLHVGASPRMGGRTRGSSVGSSESSKLSGSGGSPRPSSPTSSPLSPLRAFKLRMTESKKETKTIPSSPLSILPATSSYSLSEALSSIPSSSTSSSGGADEQGKSPTNSKRINNNTNNNNDTSSTRNNRHEHITPAKNTKTITGTSSGIGTNQGKQADADEYVKLHNLSEEEKKIIHNLVNITRSKNELLSSNESAHREDMHNLLTQLDNEKVAMKGDFLLMQRRLQDREVDLEREAMHNLDLSEQLQASRCNFIAAQGEIVQIRQAYEDCRRYCDGELKKQAHALHRTNEQLKHLTKLRDSLDCVVCEEHHARVLLSPCHHLVLCTRCASACARCPMCRGDIAARHEVYSNWMH